MLYISAPKTPSVSGLWPLPPIKHFSKTKTVLPQRFPDEQLRPRSSSRRPHLASRSISPGCCRSRAPPLPPRPLRWVMSEYILAAFGAQVSTGHCQGAPNALYRGSHAPALSSVCSLYAGGFPKGGTARPLVGWGSPGGNRNPPGRLSFGDAKPRFLWRDKGNGVLEKRTFPHVRLRFRR